MGDATFRALVIEQADGRQIAEVREIEREALPAGEVLVRVAYSTINYKDGMAITGEGKIVRGGFPFVPGIDYSGTVEESSDPQYGVGDEVMLTGWGVGEKHWGGLAELARAQGVWLVPLPAGMSLRRAAGIGTAGLTAMIAVLALEAAGLKPGGQPVVVTGAAGGVGSVAVALLARLGYEVAASTGRAELHDYLRRMGATQLLERSELATGSTRPLESERWAGAVDAVGGTTLATLLKTMAYGSSIAACGLAGGADLATTVLPFILRGVSLLGIESVNYPRERRLRAWERLAHDLPAELLDEMIEEVPLAAVPELAQAILKGQVRGRTVVNVNA